MIWKWKSLYWIVVYAMILGAVWFAGTNGVDAVMTMMSDERLPERICVIIDAGHGGVDGGTTSCTGVAESHLNLEMSLRLDDFLHLLGVNTKMIRTTDCSVYTSGESIAAKKISDLKERVRIVETTENGVLLSIHQNYFQQSVYSGAQVFFSRNPKSQMLAEQLQANIIATLNRGSKRNAKKANGIYLMEKVTRPAVLVECGFLSNPAEESLLRSEDYQKKLCVVIGCTISNFVNSGSPIT